MVTDSGVLFFNNDTNYRLQHKNAIRTLVKNIASDFGYKLSSLNYIFCTDEFLYRVNLQFLKHDTLTDIITFDYSEGREIKGEAYISIERVKENAKKFNTTLYEEVLRVIFHAVLHLVGFKDKTQSEEEKMRIKENYYLEMFFNFSKASS